MEPADDAGWSLFSFWCNQLWLYLAVLMYSFTLKSAVTSPMKNGSRESTGEESSLSLIGFIAASVSGFLVGVMAGWMIFH